jgi:hypothetical protein
MFSRLQIREFYNEFYDHLGGALRSVQQAIESTERNVEWMDKNYHDVLAWLEEENNGSKLYFV